MLLLAKLKAKLQTTKKLNNKFSLLVSENDLTHSKQKYTAVHLSITDTTLSTLTSLEW